MYTKNQVSSNHSFTHTREIRLTYLLSMTGLDVDSHEQICACNYVAHSNNITSITLLIF